MGLKLEVAYFTVNWGDGEGLAGILGFGLACKCGSGVGVEGRGVLICKVPSLVPARPPLHKSRLHHASMRQFGR